MIAANAEDENGEKGILMVDAYYRMSTDNTDQAVSIAFKNKEINQKIISNSYWKHAYTIVNDRFSGTDTLMQGIYCGKL
jgi:hypothetical protein